MEVPAELVKLPVQVKLQTVCGTQSAIPEIYKDEQGRLKVIVNLAPGNNLESALSTLQRGGF